MNFSKNRISRFSLYNHDIKGEYISVRASIQWKMKVDGRAGAESIVIQEVTMGAQRIRRIDPVDYNRYCEANGPLTVGEGNRFVLSSWN